jgi:hypothetical protein
MNKILQSCVAMLRLATFWWSVLFFFIVGMYGDKGIMHSLGFSIGATLFLVTVAIFVKWLESKQKINN